LGEVTSRSAGETSDDDETADDPAEETGCGCQQEVLRGWLSCSMESVYFKFWATGGVLSGFVDPMVPGTGVDMIYASAEDCPSLLEEIHEVLLARDCAVTLNSPTSFLYVCLGERDMVIDVVGVVTTMAFSAGGS
jgi:hypothetical protein